MERIWTDQIKGFKLYTNGSITKRKVGAGNKPQICLSTKKLSSIILLNIIYCQMLLVYLGIW